VNIRSILLQPLRRPKPGIVRAFTLIELMAVVLVILVLAAIAFGVTGYVKRRVAISVAKAQIATLEAALETYKSDWGYYPRTGPGRISLNSSCEGSNTWVLYRALSGAAGRKYMTFPASMLRSNYQLPALISGTITTACISISDPWGKFYNYFNSPSTAYTNIQNNNYAGYTLGGQMNVSSYDLFSYGPDSATFVPDACGFCYPWYGWYNVQNIKIRYSTFADTNSANDDITNWR